MAVERITLDAFAGTRERPAYPPGALGSVGVGRGAGARGVEVWQRPRYRLEPANPSAFIRALFRVQPEILEAETDAFSREMRRSR